MIARICLLFVLALSTLCKAEDKSFASFIELPWCYVIGAHSDGKWLSSETAGKRLSAEKTAYRVFTLTGEVSAVSGAKAAPNEDVCPDVWMQKLTPEPEEQKHAIGVNAVWNPMPRKAKPTDTTQDVYVQAVRDLLVSKGIAKPKVKITQLLRVDLDGDGEDEVLITATHYTNTVELLSAKAGDYCLVAMRRLVKGKVQTQIINGEFYSQNNENSAPNTYEIGGLLDLNGDGKLEVIIKTGYYEGGGTQVWRLSQDKLMQVLIVECGA